MDETLREIEKFHGHLGPYAVIGYKMGEIANKRLGSDPFSKKVVIWTGNKTPLSCIIDGIQISSGCTLGKGNIQVKNKNLPKAEFSNNSGETITITLKSDVKKEIDTTVTEENIVDYSKLIYKKSDEDLFEIK